MGKLSRAKRERRQGIEVPGGKLMGGEDGQKMAIRQIAEWIGEELDRPEPGIRAAAVASQHYENTVRSSQELAAKGLPVINPGPIDCAQGCHFCCHQAVEVSVPEVIRIAHFIRKTATADDLEIIRRRIDATIAASEGMDAPTRVQTNVPCVFLTEQGECAVYPARPVQCRSFASQDVGACRRSYEGFKQWLLVREPGRTVLCSMVLTGLHVALGRAGLDDEVIELARGLKIALDNPDAEERWRKGERLFAPAHASRVHPRPFPEPTIYEHAKQRGYITD